MKKDMPLEGLRWSRDSGSALYDTPQTAVLGRAGGGGTVQTIAHFFDINQKITNKTRIFMHFVPRNR